MSKIKVLVVDDSAFMRKLISDLLQTTDIEVIDTAKNGQDALDKLKVLKPDVVTLDVEMPIMDGLTALKEIKKLYSMPVIMLSSTTSVGAENTMLALENGAFDFVPKPSGSISLDIHKVKEELVSKIRISQKETKKEIFNPKESPILYSSRTLASSKNVDKGTTPTPTLSLSNTLSNIVLIGTSTGGPKALNTLLSHLPKLNNTAILIVQHMPAGFTKSLAKRLNDSTVHFVEEAVNDEPIVAGKVYIAPGGFHMKAEYKKGLPYICLTEEAPRGGHRPSVDVLFESAASMNHLNLISVIMTGMGKDGTSGLRALTSKKSVSTIAEAQSSCVVFGMPRVAIEEGLINVVSPLNEIHHSILQFLKK